MIGLTVILKLVLKPINLLMVIKLANGNNYDVGDQISLINNALSLIVQLVII